MIQPLGHRLLVKPENIEDLDPAYAAAKRVGIEIAGTEKTREQAGVEKGIVVSMGATAFKDFGGDPWCAIGDVVGYTRFGGRFLKDPETKEDYIILNDEDIICRYAGEKNE